MEISKDRIAHLLKQGDLESALGTLMEYKSKNDVDQDVLYLEVDVYSGLQEYGKAINVLNEMLTHYPDDEVAKAKKEQIETILKFVNLDIYANPNLSHDPWD